MALSDDLKFKLVVTGIAVVAVVYVGRRATALVGDFAGGAFNYGTQALQWTRETAQSVASPVLAADDWLAQYIGTPDSAARAIDDFFFNVAPPAIGRAANTYGDVASRGLPPAGAAWFGGS